MQKLLFLSMMMIQSIIIFSQIDTTESVLDFVIEEVVPNEGNRILNFTYHEFLDSTTSKFDSISAFKKMPWKIKGIYSFLKDKKEIVYEVEEISTDNNIIKSKSLIGFKIHLENEEIEARLYNYSKNDYVERSEPIYMTIKSEIVKLTPVQHPQLKLVKKSKDENLKFIPFIPLSVFRILDKKELIKINTHEYQCVQVEGFDELFPGDLWKYWMVVDSPGLIAKAIKENYDKRYTWILKEIK